MKISQQKSLINRTARKILREIRRLRQYGPAYAWWRIRTIGSDYRKNELWMRKHAYTPGELRAQRQEGSIPGITFSVIVPLYNTPERFLKEMIESVLGQRYPGWELCLGDGSDEQHGFVGEICGDYVKRDGRIRYKKLEKNLGISGNSNACLEMASGQFIALMDHDDILHEAALYEVARVIRDRNPDVIYTDEAVVESAGIHRIHHFFHKQDYGIDHLRSNNYFCHLTVFRRCLLEKIGGFRSEYDGSQDHDLMLRIIAVTDRVEHIPKVLYFWRASETSSANDNQAKAYAYTAGAKAVTEHLRVSEIPGSAFPDQPGISRIVYEIKGKPLVSILMIRKGSYQELEQHILSIVEKTTYSRYEIVIIDAMIPDEEKGVDEKQNRDEERRRIRQRWSSVRFFDQQPGKSRYMMYNHAVKEKWAGDYLLFLDAEAKIISPGWIEELLMYAQRKDVGAVGAMLYYLDDTIRYAGYILGGDHCVTPHCYRHSRGEIGYFSRLRYAQDLSAVSDACMMIRRETWERFAGFDPAYTASLGDVDLCLRMRKDGMLVVWTPWAELYSGDAPGRRGTPSGLRDFNGPDAAFFRKRWEKQILAGDPYYNPNLSLDRGDYSLAWETVFRSRRQCRREGMGKT